MLIDCHAHHIAAPYNTMYLKWLGETHNSDFGPFYLWNDPAFEDETLRYEKMAAASIDCSVITYSANITQIIDAVSAAPSQRCHAVQILNDRTIKLCKHSDGRLIPTGLIDLRLGCQALGELERCAADVKGYSVLSAYSLDGRIRYLDDPVFEPFWCEAEQMGKPVFIHFSNLYKINDSASPIPGFMNDTLLYAGMGQLVEDCLCVARMVLSGLFDRHPGLKVVMGQSGGLYPFMLERMEMLYGMYAAGAKRAGRDVFNPEVPQNFLRNMKNYTDHIYVDTHSMDEASVRCAAEILGEDKIMYGSDYPITPDHWGMFHAQEKLSRLPEQLKSAIYSENARRLLKLSMF